MLQSNLPIFLSLTLFNTWLAATLPPGQEDWEKVRSIAESEHEIVMLLIENKEFDSVPAEAKKIFSMNFPEEHQDLLMEGTQEIVDALIHHRQYRVADNVVDQCMRKIKARKLLSELHKQKAYLLKKMGKDDEAMKHFRKAIELTEESGSP
jgi:tetratricopeptide (TPR) repeat protein